MTSNCRNYLQVHSIFKRGNFSDDGSIQLFLFIFLMSRSNGAATNILEVPFHATYSLAPHRWELGKLACSIWSPEKGLHQSGRKDGKIGVPRVWWTWELRHPQYRCVRGRTLELIEVKWVITQLRRKNFKFWKGRKVECRQGALDNTLKCKNVQALKLKLKNYTSERIWVVDQLMMLIIISQ